MVRRTRCLAAIGVVGALALAACGNSGDGDESGSSAPAESDAPAATDAPVDTDAPTETDAPAATDAPVETDAPTETDAPAATDAPVDTDPPTPDDERDTFVEIEGVPGVDGEEIRYASIALEANNPLGIDIKNAYNAGIRAYFDWRNDEGGIYQRELVLAKEIDDEFVNNQAMALEVIGADNDFGVFVATLIFAGAADLNDAGIPTYGWNISPTTFAGLDALFGNIAVGCTGCVGRASPYVATQVGATTVATIGYGVSENSKVCTQTLRDSYDFYQPDIGIEVGYYNDDLAFGLPNGIGPEVTAMKDAGVQFVAACIDLNGMKTLAQELSRQGMDDVVLYHPNSYDQAFVAEGGELFEGDWVVAAFLPFEYESGLEAHEKFFEFMDAQGIVPTELAMIGWINADLAFKGLLAAGPDFDRQKVIDATNQMTAYNAGGLIVPINWTRQHNPTTPETRDQGYEFECFAPVTIAGGVFEPVGDPSQPWICWSNATNEWGEPEAMSFES